MLKVIQQLLDLNSALLAKARSATTYDRALALYEAKEYSKAFPLMREAAELGSLQAMSILGSMYLLGRGARENGIEAERWLKRAVDGGFEGAISVLGMAYATGRAGIILLKNSFELPCYPDVIRMGNDEGYRDDGSAGRRARPVVLLVQSR
jgi:TPR repeat protein